MNILVTGCFGFIGYNFIKFLEDNDLNFIGIDSLETNSAKNLFEISKNSSSSFYNIDICDLNDNDILKDKKITAIVNFAAQTHVDNSISSPELFINSNVLGVTSLLKFAMNNNIENILHISTDEVYGSNEEGFFDEVNPFKPSSPYSASKASAELICQAFNKTYDLNIKIARPANNYGIYQQPEKLIPYSIAQLLNGNNVEIYGEGQQIRHWLHVSDTVNGLFKILTDGEQNEVYNIGSEEYLKNLDLIKILLGIFELDDRKITYVEDRPGHDFRYAINLEKIHSLGWKAENNIETSLSTVVDWYIKNQEFWLDDYKKIVEKRKNRLHIL